MLRINSRDWKVWTHTDEAGSEDPWGRTYFPLQEISVAEDLIEPTFQETLLHEILHIVSEDAMLDLKEAQIQGLVIGLINCSYIQIGGKEGDPVREGLPRLCDSPDYARRMERYARGDGTGRKTDPNVERSGNADGGSQ